MLNRDDIEKLSALARVALSEEEQDALAADLDRIVSYVSEIKKAAGSETPEPLRPLHRNIFREDAEPHESGIYTEALLKEAPKVLRGYIKVKKIIAQD